MQYFSRVAKEWSLAGGCCVALSLCSCAGGMPMMHGAHTLPDGQVRFAGGASANFAFGQAVEAIDDAAAEPVGAVVDRPSEQYTRGALAMASISPGVAPFVAGRVGLGYDGEGGLSYSGRAVRIDGRWAAQNESYALSMGAGASALLSRRGSAPDARIGGLNLEATTGWGVDVPLIFGWRSSAEILWWWSGVRGGYENLRGSVGYEAPEPALPIDGNIDGNRTYVLGLTGIAAGFRHLHAAVEIQGGYHWAKGRLWDNEVEVQGVTLTPAAALIGRF